MERKSEKASLTITGRAAKARPFPLGKGEKMSKQTKPRGRPLMGKALRLQKNIMIDPDVLRRLSAITSRTGESHSNIINRALEAWLDEHDTKHLSLIHISEPTRLRRISYAVFCLKKKK